MIDPLDFCIYGLGSVFFAIAFMVVTTAVRDFRRWR